MSNIYFIKIKDGKIFEYPYTLDSMQLNFPELDINNPPEGFVRYYKLCDIDIPKRFTHYGEPYDEIVGNAVYQKMEIRPYTDEEKEIYKLEHIEYLKSLDVDYHEQWIYQEDEGIYLPPCDPPTDGRYIWDKETAYWKRIGDWESDI